MENLIYQKCIISSSASAVACFQCVKALNKESGDSSFKALIALLNACASLCLVNLESLATESKSLIEVCNNCEEICVECAEACGKHPKNEYCQKAAIICSNNAMECKQITEM
jgi:hypothetical protein